MDELAEVYFVENIEQMRAIADPLRLRIFDRLTRQPLTVTQLGEELGETPAKTHYHVRELERIGIVKLVETREKSGILEKYYRAIAKSLQMSPDMLRSSSPDEITVMVQEWFALVMNEGLKALRANTNQPENHDPMAFTSEGLWATVEEFRAVLRQIEETLQPYHDPRGIADEREWMLSYIAHGMTTDTHPSDIAPERNPVGDLPDPPNPPLRPFPPRPVNPIMPPRPPAAPRGKRVFAAGAFSLDQRDLERALAEGKQMDISIIGLVHFANDIPAELVDRAVRTFRHKGILQASPEVRAALQRKEKQAEPT